jgi:hypothetical protein
MDETATAKRTQDSFRVDLRRRRAEALVAMTMQAIDPFLNRQIDTARSDAFYALLDLFTTRGVEVLTDADRADAGLPCRGEDGWTPNELEALEKVRLATLLRPLTVFASSPSQQQEKE